LVLVATRKKVKRTDDVASRITTPQELGRGKLLIYSRHKKGKTLFCMTAPDVLIIDPEHGTDPFPQRAPKVFHVETWADIDDIYRYLRHSEHDFEWVGVDGVTKLHSMALRHVRKEEEERNLDRQPGLVTRRDYGRAGELIKDMIINFHNLPMGVVFTAQERIIEAGGDDEEDSNGETSETLYVPDLPKSARGFLNTAVDLIGRLYVHPVRVKRGDKVVMKNQRRLYVDTHTRYETGYRSDFELPPTIKNPTVPKLMALLRGE
jgi:hypothetical protein